MTDAVFTHPFPTPSQAESLEQAQAAFLGARKDLLSKVEAFASHFLEAFALKTPLTVSLNQQDGSYDDDGHSYSTVTDWIRLNEDHPLRHAPEWAWLDETELASDREPCGDFLDDLGDLLVHVPDEAMEGPDGEQLRVVEWLAKTLELPVDYVGEALGALQVGRFEAYAALGRDGQVSVSISEMV